MPVDPSVNGTNKDGAVKTGSQPNIILSNKNMDKDKDKNGFLRTSRKVLLGIMESMKVMKLGRRKGIHGGQNRLSKRYGKRQMPMRKSLLRNITEQTWNVRKGNT